MEAEEESGKSLPFQKIKTNTEDGSLQGLQHCYIAIANNLK